MKVAVVRESFPGERRVALIPANVPQLVDQGAEVLVEAGAGHEAGYADQEYTAKGARLVHSRRDAFAADVILQVRALGANLQAGRSDLELIKNRHTLVGLCDPLGEPQAAAEIAKTGATLLALELIPRISRAQSMDVLSSMATLAGYKAVLLAAVELPRMFPLMMTAAGTLKAARVLIIGVGVAGLQAIATAKRLGAIVQAYDVRPACREQVESLGAKFVELELETGQAEDAGGYAKAQQEEFYRRQRELLADVVAQNDVIITTAAIPGKRSPLLVTTAAVEAMAPGSVIVDLAAERGGNCEVTQADQRVEHHGVVILGPTNLPSQAAYHGSQMFSGNVTRFLLSLIHERKLQLDIDDEIVRDTLVCRHHEVVHHRVRELLGLDGLPAAEEPSPDEGSSPDEAADADGRDADDVVRGTGEGDAGEDEADNGEEYDLASDEDTERDLPVPKPKADEGDKP